jgi:hypothetical protein
LIFYEKIFERYATRLSGGGWAEPKNGEVHFWAWGWRCGVSAANTAKANQLKMKKYLSVSNIV